MPGKCIPVEYIQRNVDLLIKTADEMSDGQMKNAVVLRASIYMDLLEQWARETGPPNVSRREGER